MRTVSGSASGVGQSVKSTDPAPACAVFERGRGSAASESYVRSARELGRQKRFGEALAKYRDLAVLDPAYPGVNLRLSVTLLALNQGRAAEEAIQSQIAASECVARLSPEALARYCQAESFRSTATCTQELGSIKQEAYYQAALVEGHAGQKPASVEVAADPADGATKQVLVSTAEASPIVGAKSRPSTRLNSAFLSVDPAEHIAVKPKPAKAAVANALATGSGTDAALGAYSK